MADKNKKLFQVIPSLLSVLIGLIAGWYLLFLTGPADSLSGLGMILSGSFSEGAPGLGNLLHTASPIILTGLSVGLSVCTGLFNIGASGQMTVGAYAAILVGVRCDFLPPVLHVVVAVLSAVLAGTLWGLLSGVLRARFRVSEVISGILLNYIGMLLVNLLIRSTVYESAHNYSLGVAPSARISSHMLDSLIPGSRIGPDILLAVAAVAAVWVLLKRTALGYELKMTGKNPHVGRYCGIFDKRNTCLTLALCGALSGLAGAVIYLSDFGDHIYVTETILPQGFTGISVALLGMSDPLGILAAGLFIAYLTIGGNSLQLYGYTPDIVNMIIAIIVYCGALTVPIRLLIDQLVGRKKKKHSLDDLEEGGAE